MRKNSRILPQNSRKSRGQKSSPDKLSNRGDKKAVSEKAVDVENPFADASISNNDFLGARIDDLVDFSKAMCGDNHKRLTEHTNASAVAVWGMSPRDHVEVCLLVQMQVTHNAAIRAMIEFERSQYIAQTQILGNLATKLLRTYQGQMETLARIRRGGEQIVRHIHVDNRGGQAVIAENVQTRGSENGKIDDQSHATRKIGSGPALLGADALGNGVPITGCEGQAEMPDARGNQSRRTHWQSKRTKTRRTLRRD